MNVGVIGGADGPTSSFLASPWGGFDGFGLFGVFFMLMFLLVAGVIIYTLVKSARQGIHNSRSPQLTVEAAVVAKRTKVWGERSRTSYYVTFQVESGDRMELQLEGEQYGLLAEGDRGQLTFQGTRYLGFERM